MFILSPRPLALAAILVAAATLSAREEAGKPEVGKPAPAFDLPATSIASVLPDRKDAKKISLADFKGKKNVVLFFYPKAMTKGCTIESRGSRDKNDDFAKLDTAVIGISTDKLEDQVKFTEKEMLKTPLLADPDKKVTEAFGALSTTGFAKRYTFVIDKKGVVRKIYTTVNPANHPDEVMKFVKENLK